MGWVLFSVLFTLSLVVLFNWYTIYPWLLTQLGDVMIATSLPDTTGKDIINLMNQVQPGDVVCRRFDCYLDSYFIPGKYTHSGIITSLGNGCSQVKIMDSMAEGICEKYLLDFVKNCDGFILLRPKYAGEEAINNALTFARSKNGYPYDFYFDLDDPASFYCHEFTANCLQASGIKVPHGKYYLAENLIEICDKILETADRQSSVSRASLQNPEVYRVMRKNF